MDPTVRERRSSVSITAVELLILDPERNGASPKLDTIS